jgi:hypothetical protein
MSNDILHQFGRMIAENDATGALGKVTAIVCNLGIAFWIWLGTVNDSFLRVFDPATWTLQDYASFASLIAALMYFIKNFSDWRMNKRKEARELKAELEAQNADLGN